MMNLMKTSSRRLLQWMSDFKTSISANVLMLGGIAPPFFLRGYPMNIRYDTTLELILVQLMNVNDKVWETPLPNSNIRNIVDSALHEMGDEILVKFELALVERT